MHPDQIISPVFTGLFNVRFQDFHNLQELRLNGGRGRNQSSDQITQAFFMHDRNNPENFRSLAACLPLVSGKTRHPFPDKKTAPEGAASS